MRKLTRDIVLKDVKAACEFYGRYPSGPEYTKWAREHGAVRLNTVYKHLGTWKEIATELGYEYQHGNTGKNERRGKYKTGISNAKRMELKDFEKVRSNYLNKKEIYKRYNVSDDTLRRFIQDGRFPEPDVYVPVNPGGGLYWHRLGVEEALSNYRYKMTETKYKASDKERREHFINKARKYIIENDIKTPREYIRSTKVKKGYVDPKTLWTYSITFEEIIGKKIITDPVCRDILNLLELGDRTSGQLAHHLQVSDRTIYRKIKNLRQLGYNIASDRGGLKLLDNNEEVLR